MLWKSQIKLESFPVDKKIDIFQMYFNEMLFNVTLASLLVEVTLVKLL